MPSQALQRHPTALRSHALTINPFLYKLALMISRNDPCWCGSGKKWKKCHWPEKGATTLEETLRQKFKKQYGIILKNERQIEGIRHACRKTKELLDLCVAAAKQGTTTNEIDQIAVDYCKQHGFKSAPYRYGNPPFPKSICTSLNEVICHGIPDDRPLQEGDFLNIDVSLIVDGYFGDCSAMVAIGEISEEKKRVMETSYECLMRSIEPLKPGMMLYEIGQIIEDHAKSRKCSVVNQFVGHGVGLKFHEPPQVPHHYNDVAIPLAPGMTFTIEPMINAGVRTGKIDPIDGWTCRTLDGKPSAQWEHTILITHEGHEILTQD